MHHETLLTDPMSRKSLYLTLLVIAVSLATVALSWLLVAPWRLERVWSEIYNGSIEPLTAMVFGGPLIAGAAAAIVRLSDRPRRPHDGGAGSNRTPISDSAA